MDKDNVIAYAMDNPICPITTASAAIQDSRNTTTKKDKEEAVEEK